MVSAIRPEWLASPSITNRPIYNLTGNLELAIDNYPPATESHLPGTIRQETLILNIPAQLSPLTQPRTKRRDYDKSS